MREAWNRLAEAQRRIKLWLRASNDEVRKEMLSLGLIHYLEMCLEEVDEIEEEEDRQMLARGETEEQEEKRLQKRSECRNLVCKIALGIWQREREEEYELLTSEKRRTEALLISHVVGKLRNSDDVTRWFPSLVFTGHFPWNMEVDERSNTSPPASNNGALRGGAGSNNDVPQIGGLNFPNSSWPDFDELDSKDEEAEAEAEAEVRKDSSRPENERLVNQKESKDAGPQISAGSSSTASDEGKEAVEAPSEEIGVDVFRTVDKGKAPVRPPAEDVKEDSSTTIDKGKTPVRAPNEDDDDDSWTVIGKDEKGKGKGKTEDKA
ncbi:hypothetical protein IWX50DRAFT_675820, partial [Phyllosticta citricarpa]